MIDKYQLGECTCTIQWSRSIDWVNAPIQWLRSINWVSAPFNDSEVSIQWVHLSMIEKYQWGECKHLMIEKYQLGECIIQLDMSTARRHLKSPQSRYGTSAHPIMVTHWSRPWSWMIDLQPFLSVSISAPHPHSSNKAISNVDL